MAKTSTDNAKETALVAQQEGTAIERINAFLATIPTVDDDPTDAMLNAALQAVTPAEWNSMFSSRSLRDAKGARVQINAYRTQPSDFEGGLSHYLVLDVTDLESGEKGVLTCSSQMAIAQILNAQAQGFWPIRVRIVEKDKPTRNGFRPIHLEYLAAESAPIGDPSKVVAEQ